MTVLNMDCRIGMSTLFAENDVDAIVTDPPYELTSARPGGRSPATQGKVMKGFMGMAWDGSGVAFDVRTWREALRVLKPGGHLLAFSGTRTYHRMVCAIEDAGFEVRDQIGWLYGSGFPKSHNGEWGGTALKPAWEPIVVARKPLIGTVEANWRAHGTGALNIDGCRVPTDENLNGGAYSAERQESESPWGSLHKSTGEEFVQPVGRWPANVIHDGSDEVLAAFPDAAGQQGVAKNDGTPQGNRIYGALTHGTKNPQPRVEMDKSAARFFYCAKASKRDRNEGLDDFPLKPSGMVSNTSGQHMTRRDGGAPGPTANNHPTVKPTELMRYLCRLVTPPGGLVLDPFAGSGSTGKAAHLEGFRFIGFEQSIEYAEIANARIGGIE